MIKRFLIFALLILFLAGCGADQYSIEKRFWGLSIAASDIFMSPDSSPPKQLERTVGELNDFINDHPENSLSIDADFMIFNLYLVKKEFALARGQVDKIFKKYPYYPEVLARAVFLRGKSYELEDRWNLALEQYNQVIREYPLTMAGVEAPIYIAVYYKVKFQPEKMVEAYKEAARHYESLAEEQSAAPEGLVLLQLTTECYSQIKDWSKVIDTMNLALERYEDKIQRDAVLFGEALVYYRDLKNEAKAREILGELISEYPQSKLVDSAKAFLEEINKNEE